MRRDLAALSAIVLLASSSATARNRDMEILQNDVGELQRQLVELTRMVEQQGIALRNLVDLLGGTTDSRRAIADFNANVENLGRDISEMTNRFDRTEERLRGIEERLADLRSSTAEQRQPWNGVTPPEGSVPGDEASSGLPSGETSDDYEALYNRAYGDYLSDNLDLAISQFREFIAGRPHHDLADNAQYWIAMSYFNSRRFAPALREFDTLLERYPQADNVTEAMYRKGLCLAELQQLGQAVLVLTELVDRYPETPAARQAEQRLRELSQRNP